MRVLRVLTRPNVGGPMKQAVALWHAHRAMGVRTVIVVGRCEGAEVAMNLERTGIPRIALESLNPDSEGILVVPPMQRRLSIAGDWRAYATVRRSIRQFRPDVVHTHTTKAGWLGRRAAIKEGVRSIAHTFHGHVFRDYHANWTTALLRYVECRLARHTTLMLAVSDSCREELIELGIASQICCVRPAVDTSAFRRTGRAEARRLLGIEDTEFVLGFVGRLVPIKRVDLFVQLVDRLPDVRGIIFGDGPDRGQSRADRIRWHRTTEELPRYMSAFDLLVLPSRREGFPLVGIEAAAAGVSTVGFDVPGVRDLLEHGATGLSCPVEEDIDGLVECVQRIREGGVPKLGPRAEALIDSCAPRKVAGELYNHYRSMMR